MATIALPLINILLGAGNLGAGIGFSEAAKAKMKTLKDKMDALKKDVEEAGDFYDNTYYMVAVNLDRVSKDLDSLPYDFLADLKNLDSSVLPDDNKAVDTLASVLGYTKEATEMLDGILEIVKYSRSKRGSNEVSEENDAFGNVPLDGKKPLQIVVEEEYTFSKSLTLENITKGIDVAAVECGVASLALIIEQGVKSLEEINDAIDKVDKKQDQVTEFQNAMKSAMNVIIKASGFEVKTYSELKSLAKDWKKISHFLENYADSLKWAIKGYYKHKTLDQIKSKVKSVSKPKMPFPNNGYPIAKAFADDIRYLHEKQNKNAAAIVDFFIKDEPKNGRKFKLTEYFLNDLFNEW